MKRLMIVDDEAVITTQLEDRLQSMQYDVVGTASSAEESVRMARELSPDLILMDIVMKGKLDGVDAARMIKEYLDIPIIFLTAYADARYIERAMHVEPSGYIVKPFREEEIRANIEIALYKKELEQKRKQEEEKIRRLFLAIDHNPYIVMIMDIEGNIEFANVKFSQITSYTADEIVGKDVGFFQSDKISSEVYEEMRTVVASGEEWRGKLRIRKKDGTLVLKNTIALPVRNIKGDIAFSVLVLEKAVNCEKVSAKLLQSEKMSALRTIVAGIAHEFNNILAVVHGTAEILEDGVQGEKELKKGLNSIIKASDKGAGIVRNMIAFSKSYEDASEYVFFDLTKIIMESIDLAISARENTVHPGMVKYQIDKEGMDEIPEIFCTPAGLIEVFVNIINNAMDAMPEGGRISFSTWCDEDIVFVSISDTGEGMAKGVKEKIFDPFFTTRRPQRTGLGMGVVYSIMERHGGQIEVESDEGKGAVLTLSLPINNKIKQQKLSLQSTSEIMLKGLSILVVDDEEAICKILDKFLSKAGHMVKAVADGAEAIELAKKEDFDLVICDLAMPDVTGHDVIKALNELDKVPVIGISTGSIEDISSAEINALKAAFIIKKPFKLQELTNKIDVLFDNR